MSEGRETAEERPPWWFRRLPKGLQMLIYLRQLEKFMRDPELPANLRAIQQVNDAIEKGMRILQGKEEQEP